MGNVFLTSKGNNGSGGSDIKINGSMPLNVRYGEDILKGDLITLRKNSEIDIPVRIENFNGNNPITGDAEALDFSNDGKWLAVGYLRGVTIYRIEGENFVKISDLPVVGTNAKGAIRFNPDSTILAIGSTYTPYFISYRIIDDEFLPLESNVNSGGVVNGISFSNDGQFMSVSHSSSPFFSVYKINQYTFSKLPNPSVLPTGIGRDSGFSNDGKWLAVAHTTTPFFSLYSLESDTLTKQPNQISINLGTGYSVKFNRDDSEIFIGSNTSPFANYFDFNNGIISNRRFFSDLSGRATGSDYSYSNEYLSITSNASPFLLIYKKINNEYTRLDNPESINNSTGNSPKFSADQKFLGVAHSSSPYASVYRVNETDIYAYKFQGLSEVRRQNYYRIAIALENGAQDEINKKVTTIPI